jgi:hypothetical protein
LSSLKNIAQAPRCGSIFSFCSENKKFGYRGDCRPFLGGFYPLPAYGADKSSFPRSNSWLRMEAQKATPGSPFCAFILPQRFREFWT